MIFINTLQKIPKQELILQVLNQTDHQLKEKIKKVNGLMKEKLGVKIMMDTLIKSKNLQLLFR